MRKRQQASQDALARGVTHGTTGEYRGSEIHRAEQASPLNAFERMRGVALRASITNEGPEGSGLRGSGRVFLAELVDAATGVYDFLLAGIERMAVRTDFDSQVLTDGGSGQKGVPASAGDRDLFVIRMDASFHKSLVYL
jgi:hypothetical protein